MKTVGFVKSDDKGNEYTLSIGKGWYKAIQKKNNKIVRILMVKIQEAK